MANFTFDNGNAAGGTNGADGKPNGGEPGSNNGAPSTANGNNGIEGAGNDPNGQVGGVAKKRGRKPYPRDAAGNIIRPAPSATDKSNGEGLAITNDRAKVKQNIVGLHAMAAVLTKQPIWNISEQEGVALTNSLCEVADYHGINLIQAGGAFGLYASLATCTYMIYVPRLVAIKKQKAGEQPQPLNPGDTREKAMNGSFKMDFSNDTAH